MIFRASHTWLASRKEWRAPVLLLVGVYFFSGLSPIATSFDSRWTVFIAESLWNHHNTKLDEYADTLGREAMYSLECIDAKGTVVAGPQEHCDGHWYSGYPIGGPVLTTPLIVAAVEVVKLLRPISSHFHSSQPAIAGFLRADWNLAHPIIEEEVASFLLAVSTVILYFIARRFLPVKRAVLLSLLFAVGTSAYSTAGRALWQHTPSLLLLTIIIFLLLGAEEHPAWAAWAGLPVALTFTVRPTDSLFVVIFTAYVAVRHSRYLLRYLLAALPVAAIWIGYNFSIYHELFSPYYHTHLDGLYPSNWSKLKVGLAGNLVSPSRGLFVFTPVFLFALWSMIRGKWTAPLSRWLFAIVILHWVAVSAYIADWWGGHSYGPRFFTDMTPIFVLFLIPYFENWERLARPLRIAFVALAIASVAIHLRGGWSGAVYRWNVDPVNIDERPARAWDWSDPQFLRH
jgi:hypothetical protein